MSSLFNWGSGGGSSSSSSVPAPPPPKPVAPMPDREDPLVLEAERRRIGAVLGRSMSRRNTILSQGGQSDAPYSKSMAGE